MRQNAGREVPSQFFMSFEDKFVDLLRKTLCKVIGEELN